MTSSFLGCVKPPSPPIPALRHQAISRVPLRTPSFLHLNCENNCFARNSACWVLHDFLFSFSVFNFKIYWYLRFASILFSKMGYIHVIIFSLNNGSSCQERINSLGPVTSMFTRISDIEFIREGQVFKRWRQLQERLKIVQISLI